MKKSVTVLAASALAVSAPGNSAAAAALQAATAVVTEAVESEALASSSVDGDAELAERLVYFLMSARSELDFAAMEAFRPGYTFWRHVFTIPDGAVAFGSRDDGRLLAIFPTRGDWTRAAHWEDSQFATLLQGQRLPAALTQRRDRVAELFEATSGPVVHNQTRGNFLLPNVRRYGAFLEEWSAIYERFGVPSELGLAQALIESGFKGTVRSEAGALGFCQWLPRNWERMNRLSPHVIEVQNQTTQAPYCAAYLAILSTKYGTFIPALSEHHAGGANVGRAMINGGRLGAADARGQYFLGAQFARDLRDQAPRAYTDIYRTYGPRSFLYAEMVFGNAVNVIGLRESTPQQKVFAMRAPRNIPLTEVTRRTGLSVDEVRRFNPALIRQVPAGANLYLPTWVEAFGPDVSFWHRPSSAAFAGVLHDFLALETSPEEFDAPAFQPVLREFQRRFRETGTEEGTVMATVLAYVMQESASAYRILAEYRTSPRILQLFERGAAQWEPTFSNGNARPPS